MILSRIYLLHLMLMMAEDQDCSGTVTFTLSVEDGSDVGKERKLFLINFSKILYMEYVKEEGEHSFIETTDSFMQFRV